MIKLKKIVAVALATTMVMGLSMTASAMNIASPYYGPAQQSEHGTQNTEIRDSSVKDALGNDVTDISFDQISPTSEAAESINTAKKLANVLAANDASIPTGASVTPIYAANLVDVPKDGATLTFALNNFDPTGDDYTQYRAGDTLYALVQAGEGSDVWELMEGTINKKGEVEFQVDHDGAFVLFKTINDKTGKMVKLTYKNGTLDPENPPVIIDPEQPDQPQPISPTPGTSQEPANGQNANGAANANGSTWTSPKTGEF